MIKSVSINNHTLYNQYLNLRWSLLRKPLGGARGTEIDSLESESFHRAIFDDNNNIVGHVRSAAYSPTFKKVVGIAMINKPYWNTKDQFKLEINEKIYVGTVCDLPFI